MKTAHPGCGGHAGSKGYNSGGHYCGGWAGNCGDGGVGGSSWYGFCVLNFLSIPESNYSLLNPSSQISLPRGTDT
mgnify:CR=1 FL=1